MCIDTFDRGSKEGTDVVDASWCIKLYPHQGHVCLPLLVHFRMGLRVLFSYEKFRSPMLALDGSDMLSYVMCKFSTVIEGRMAI